MRTINNIKTISFNNLGLDRLNNIKLSYYTRSENLISPISILDTETTIKTYKINDYETYKNNYFYILVSAIFNTTDDLSSEKVELFLYDSKNNLLAYNFKQFIETESLVQDFNNINFSLIHKLQDNTLILKAVRSGTSALTCYKVNFSMFNLPINNDITKNNILDITES